MTRKLWVRQGGGTAVELDFLNRWPIRKGTPLFEGRSLLLQMGQRFADGESTQGYFKLVDPDAELSSSGFRLRPWSEVRLTEDASGDELTLAWMRLAGGSDAGRRVTPGVGGDEIEHSPQLMDCNLDLRGIPFRAEWERPAETDRARLEALEAEKLNGASSTSNLYRITTNITVGTVASGHLMEVATPVDLDAKTYPPGTEVTDIIADIAEQSGKNWGVVLHHTGGSTHKCLLYIDQDDFTTYTTDVRISDDLADIDEEDPTAPTFAPRWMQGPGREANTEDVVSGLISIYGGLEDEPSHVFVTTGESPDEWETFVSVFNDDEATSLTAAERRANWQLNDRKRPYVSHRPSILLSAEQAHLLEAGMAIETKSVVMNSGPDKNSWVWRRIAEKKIEPNHDGRYWVHLSLERPRKAHGANGGGVATTPKPAPECLPTPDDAITELSNSTDDTWPGTLATTDPCWGGDTYRSANGSGGIGPSPSQAISAGDVIRATLNFRNETGNDAWENVTNYNYHANLQFTGSGMPTLSYSIVNQRYHNTGCIDVTHERTETVPVGYTAARVKLEAKLGGYKYYGTLSEVDPAEVPENDPDCIPAGSGGDSKHFARSDDPRFDNDDQHLITHIQQRVVNSSGGTLQVGDVVVPDITEDDPSVTTTTTAATTDAMVGIVTTAMGDGETGVVMWSGVFVRTLNVDGTPAVGDYLATSTSAGAADTSSTRDTGSVGRIIAVDGTPDTTFVLWWGAPDSGSGSGVSDHGALTGLADDDHIQYVRTTLGGRDVVSTVAAAGSTETLDLATANFHDVTLSADCTFTLSGATNGVACYMQILLRQGTGAPWEVTWPASVTWVGGAAPTLQTGEDEWDLITLVTRDGGTVWFGDAGSGLGGSSSSTADTTASGHTALFPGSTITATKDAGNPTFNFSAIPENIIKEGDTYYAVYTAGPAGAIHLATATDRDGPWTAGATIFQFSDIGWEHDGQDILYAPEFIKVDDTYYLYYAVVDESDGTNGEIGVATATAITGPYTDHGSAVLTTAASGAWDSLRVGEPSVIYHDGRWVMAYMGEDTDFSYQDSEQVGIATSTDGLTWTRAGSTAKIEFGTSGAWDDELVADPFIFFENGYYWIMYSGGGAAGNPHDPWILGLAYALDPTGTWTKHASNPILSAGSGADFDAGAAWRGSIWIEDGLIGGVYGGAAAGLGTFKGGNFRLTVTSADASAHISDTSDAHDASAISISDAGNLYTATDVEGALQEVAAAAAGTSWVVDPGTPAYSGTGPVTVALTSVFGITAGGSPYYNSANVTDGEEAALVWDPVTDSYALRRYY